jgi:hypothetical protein
MSSNNQPNAFEKGYAAAQIAASILSPGAGLVPQSPNPATQSEYSEVQESEANKAYEALEELSQSNLELEEQLEWAAETTADEKIEQREEDLETSLMADRPIAAGGPDPETETGEGETFDWVGLALNSINSSVETETESSHESEEIESESSESESESESEAECGESEKGG